MLDFSFSSLPLYYDDDDIFLHCKFVNTAQLLATQPTQSLAALLGRLVSSNLAGWSIAGRFSRQQSAVALQLSAFNGDDYDDDKLWFLF